MTFLTGGGAAAPGGPAAVGFALVCEKNSAISNRSRAATHFAVPAFHTSVAAPIPPPVARALNCAKDSGPSALPSISTKNFSATRSSGIGTASPRDTDGGCSVQATVDARHRIKASGNGANTDMDSTLATREQTVGCMDARSTQSGHIRGQILNARTARSLHRRLAHDAARRRRPTRRPPSPRRPARHGCRRTDRGALW